MYYSVIGTGIGTWIGTGIGIRIRIGIGIWWGEGRERVRENENETTDFKELAYTIVESSKSKVCMVGRQTRDSGRVNVAAQIQSNHLAEFPLPLGYQ